MFEEFIIKAVSDMFVSGDVILGYGILNDKIISATVSKGENYITLILSKEASDDTVAINRNLVQPIFDRMSDNNDISDRVYQWIDTDTLNVMVRASINPFIDRNDDRGVEEKSDFFSFLEKISVRDSDDKN